MRSYCGNPTDNCVSTAVPVQVAFVVRACSRTLITARGWCKATIPWHPLCVQLTLSVQILQDTSTTPQQLYIQFLWPHKPQGYYKTVPLRTYGIWTKPQTSALKLSVTLCNSWHTTVQCLCCHRTFLCFPTFVCVLSLL